MIVALYIVIGLWLLTSWVLYLRLRGAYKSGRGKVWATIIGFGRVELHAPLAQYAVCAWVVGFMWASFVPHLIFRLFGRRGFYNKALDIR